MSDIQAWIDEEPQRCAWCPEPAYGDAVHNDYKLHPSCGRINHGNAWAPRAWDRLPKALAALQAVLDLHKPFEWSFGYEPVTSCRECAETGKTEPNAEYPCPTVRAIQDAIGGPQ